LVRYYEVLTRERAEYPTGTTWSFPDTGYYVMAPVPGTRLLVDCGPVGPDYQPGHSHCDTLSFELSLKGLRVVVDSGCFQYVDGDIRRYNRGSAGHNSVTIDGFNQSEVWGAHRCARRARPVYARLKKKSDGTLVFEGAHDGYCRLPGKPVHHRLITSTGSSFVIEDRIEGTGRHDMESRLHIHPALLVEFGDGRALVHDNTQVLATISRNDSGRITQTNGWYCPEFGVKKTCSVISFTCKDETLPFRCGWTIKIEI